MRGPPRDGVSTLLPVDMPREAAAPGEGAEDRCEVKKPAVLLFAAAVCVTAGVLGIDMLLARGTRLALERMADRCRALGVDITGADFDEVGPDLPMGVRWKKCVVGIAPAEGNEFPGQRAGVIQVEEVRLHVRNIIERSFVLEARGIEASLGEWGVEGRSGERVRNMVVAGQRARLVFRIDAFRPRALAARLEEALGELEMLLTEGKSTLPVTFAGIVSFSVLEKPFETGIRVVNDQRGSFLAMDEEDIAAISREFNLKKPLTRAEARLLSRNPLKAPRLFEIRSYARRVSREADRKDHAVPEDAFRHVLWSYLLTREFGPDFAKMVTDAHEEGMTGNTASEELMDLQNNALGRDYAQRGYPEQRILSLVMSDPRVVHAAD